MKEYESYEKGVAMKRMSKPDIKQEALRKYSQYIAHYGMRNGKMILWEAYKLFKKEEIRRKGLKRVGGQIQWKRMKLSNQQKLKLT